MKGMDVEFIEGWKGYGDVMVGEGGKNEVGMDIVRMYMKKDL